MTPCSVSPSATILLVDDDPVARSLMAMALSGMGLVVLQTGNGEEALELVEADPLRPIHLLLTDVVMPRIGGNELASRIQLIHPDIRILFCSGLCKEQVIHEVPGDAPVRFLRKPFDMTVLLESVRAALH